MDLFHSHTHAVTVTVVRRLYDCANFQNHPTCLTCIAHCPCDLYHCFTLWRSDVIWVIVYRTKTLSRNRVLIRWCAQKQPSQRQVTFLRRMFPVLKKQTMETPTKLKQRYSSMSPRIRSTINIFISCPPLIAWLHIALKQTKQRN